LANNALRSAPHFKELRRRLPRVRRRVHVSLFLEGESFELGGIGRIDKHAIHQLLLLSRRRLGFDESVGLLNGDLRLLIRGLQDRRLDAAGQD
jgi:hypothetical protein